MKNPLMVIWLDAVSTTSSLTRAFWTSVLQPRAGHQDQPRAGQKDQPRAGQQEGPDAGTDDTPRTDKTPRNDKSTAERAKPEQRKATLETRGAAARSNAGEPARAKKRVATGPKYRHPDDPDLTWSGRGRRPHWLTEALEAGHDLDDLKIAKR